MSESRVIIGKIIGLHGVRGWIKVYSYTRPRAAILDYSPWWIERSDHWSARELVEGRPQGKGVVARLADCPDRDQAKELLGAQIALKGDQLPLLKSGEYYWTQLEGLHVVDMAGRNLGTISHLIETGANDVMVVHDAAGPNGTREHLIPATSSVIQEVRLDVGLVRVDWDVVD
jgi:16S rRNA processing protein RimM